MKIFRLIRKIKKRRGATQHPAQLGAGFTLIELIIAIGVFTTGIMGAFTLALADLKVAKDNFNRVVAANLAREGLELARNIRDSNWLRIDGNEDCEPTTTDSLELCTWDQYLSNSASNFFTLNYVTLDSDDNPSSIKPLTDCFNKDLDECLLWCVSAVNSDCRVYLDSNGFYSQNNNLPSATNFYRFLEIKSICLKTDATECITNDQNCSSSLACNDPLSTKIGLKVTSRVGWAGNNPPDHLDAIEYLYNWRR